MEGYGTDEVYFLVLIVFILHDVAFEERLETVQYQGVHTRFTQVLCQERRQACQKAVGKRLTVDTVDDVGRCQVELFEEFLWFFRRSPTSSLPKQAPLPSSPKMNPRGDTLETILFPS